MYYSTTLTANTVAVVLAGGKGTRLAALTRQECKPALPFGGTFRNIDFSLSNCVNSGVRQIGIATQYKPGSLVRHIRQVWHETGSGSYSGASIMLWPSKSHAPCVYSGTADAVYRNWKRLKSLSPRMVLILAGDHVYKMDYRPMLTHHVQHSADMTVACIEVPIEEAHQFGVMSIDATDRVLKFREKPPLPDPAPGDPRRSVVSMGIYVFDAGFLESVLRKDADSSVSRHDFGRDILPLLIETGASVFAFRFTDSDHIGNGYWRDVGTLSAYWAAHMDLLGSPPRLTLSSDLWPIRTDDRVPDHILRRRQSLKSRISNSLLGNDCDTKNATVTRSVLSPRVVVGTGSMVSNAVLLPGVVIGRDCRLNNVIVAPDCRVPDGSVIGKLLCGHDPDQTPASLSGLVTAEMFSDGVTRVVA